MLEHTNEPQFSEAFRDREFLITGWERRRESKGEMIRSETCSIHKIAKSILEKLFFLLRRLKLQLSHTKRSPMPCFSQQFTTQSTYPESCTLIRHSDDATRHPIHISCRSSPNTPFPIIEIVAACAAVPIYTKKPVSIYAAVKQIADVRWISHTLNRKN